MKSRDIEQIKDVDEILQVQGDLLIELLNKESELTRAKKEGDFLEIKKIESEYNFIKYTLRFLNTHKTEYYYRKFRELKEKHPLIYEELLAS